MRKMLLFAPLLAGTLALAGCNEGSGQPLMEPIPVIVVDDSTYVAYLNIPPVDVVVGKGEIRDDILSLSMSFLGGCGAREFGMIAARGINKTNPPGGFLILTLAPQSDTCKVETLEVVPFDLTPYREYLQSSGLVRLGTIRMSIYGLYGFDYHF